MGGTIATLVANERSSFFNGVILLAPGIIPDPRSAAPWQIEAARCVPFLSLQPILLFI
jgi:alpha-beta hydrolase superfamily lysophospholipase